MYYAVAHHGTAGFDSFGYAEVLEGEEPRADQTTTVHGSCSKEEAEKIAAEWNAHFEQWRAEHE